MTKIKIKKLYEDSIIPQHMRKGDSGLDLHAYESIVLQAGEIKLIKTGISVEVPINFEAQVRPRSGLALKHGVTVLNTPGTVDSNYRGEVGVILINLGKNECHIKKNDRIAQLVIMQLPEITILEVDELSKTQRGCLGFGSSDNLIIEEK